MLGGLGLLAAGLALHSRDGSLASASGVFTLWAPSLLILAGAIRLGLYPVHWGLPLPWRAGSGARSLLYLLPVSAGAYLAARALAVVRSDVPGGGAWVVVGAAGLLVAGVLTWATRSRGEMLAWLCIQQACILLAAAGLQIPQSGIIVLLQGLNLPLTLALLALLENLGVPAVSDRLRLSIRGLQWFAAGSLLGLPPTLGFTARWALYRSLLEGPWWWVIFLSVLATALAIPAVVRLLDRRAEAKWPPGAIAAVTGLGVLLIVVGLQPLLLVDFATAVSGGASAGYLSDLLRTTSPRLGFMIVLAIFLPILGYWLTDEPAGQVPATRPRLLEGLELEWLSGWIHDAVVRAGALVLNLLAPIGGERYLAWALLFALIVALLLFR